MSEPVVTVIAGPGDAAAEQNLWSSLDYASLDGILEISLGNETFSFERTP